MKKGKFRDTTHVLAILQTDIDYRYRNNYLYSIEIGKTKVMELADNQLLEPIKLQMYKELTIIHGMRKLSIPIIQGSFYYTGDKGEALSCYVPTTLKMEKQNLHNWHLRKKKSKR